MFPNREKIKILIVALVLSFVVFGNGIRGDFVYDDTVVLPRPDLHHVADIPKLFITPYHYQFPQSGIYRPLPLVSFALNFIVFGDKPYSFHIINIILHALVVYFLVLFVVELSRSRGIAYASGLLFLVLPIHVEAVTSIVGRAELLCALMVLLACQYRQRWLLSGLSFLLALLSKETAIAFVPIIFILFYHYDRISLRQSLRKMLFVVPVGAVYAAMRYAALGRYIISNNADRVYNPIKFAPFPGNFLTASKVLTLYLYKIFVPLNLVSDYSYNQIPLVTSLSTDHQTVLGIAILLFFLGLLWYRSRSLIAIGSIFFLAPYFVISNLVYKTGTIMAERLMYLPTIGIVILVSYVGSLVIRYFPRIRVLVLIFLALLVSTYAGIAVARNRVWQNQESLSVDAYAKSPNSVIAKLGMAQVLVAHQRPDTAETLLKEAEDLSTENVEVLNLHGVIAWSRKDYSKAIDYFERVLTLRPSYADSLVNLSRVYYQLGNEQQALRYIKQLHDVFGSDIGLQNSILLFYLEDRSGQYATVLDQVTKMSAAIVQDSTVQFLIGYAYLKQHNISTALLYIKQADIPTIETEFLNIGRNFRQ